MHKVDNDENQHVEELFSLKLMIKLAEQSVTEMTVASLAQKHHNLIGFPVLGTINLVEAIPFS